MKMLQWVQPSRPYVGRSWLVWKRGTRIKAQFVFVILSAAICASNWYMAHLLNGVMVMRRTWRSVHAVTVWWLTRSRRPGSALHRSSPIGWASTSTVTRRLIGDFFTSSYKRRILRSQSPQMKEAIQLLTTRLICCFIVIIEVEAN